MPITDLGYLILEEDRRRFESYELSPEEEQSVNAEMKDFLRAWGLHQNHSPVYFSRTALPQWFNARGLAYYPHFSQEIASDKGILRGVLYAPTRNLGDCDRRVLTGFGDRLVERLLGIVNE